MKPPRANRYRSAWAGDLRAEQDGQEVRVAGWVHRRRDHGGLIFIDLRDRTGLLQVVFHPESAPDAHDAAHDLRAEDVISVSGRVARREEGTVNPNLPTGEIELKVAELELLADADTPPFQIDDPGTVAEEMRLRYRYLDLRRDRMREAIELRHDVVSAIRDFLRDEDFLDIETPMLTRSTPEGARDYLVPSRVQRGSWYALPQSPQLFKQLFMVAGLERYYQIVRCFRDEDPRADRQPEFTQLDMEMSFVEEEDVITLIDRLLERVLGVAGIELATPLERITYDEAILRYGTDRPDRRAGMEIQDLSSVFAGSEFKAFAGVIADGGVVRGLKAPAGEWPRKRFDDLTDRAKSLGAKGLVWAVVEETGSWRSPVAKFLSADEQAGAARELEAGEGDVLLLVADKAAMAARVLGELRLSLAGPQEGHDLLWVVDFPMFEQGEQGLEPLHHPFTSPAGDLDADPLTWRSRAYDVIMDGWELGGGSIRISDIDVQRKVFDAIGLTTEQANERFGFLLEAFRYGAPPHGGIAFGLDRIVALIAGRESIRDVIAFPKTSTAQDLLTGAPAPANDAQLKELGVSVQKPPAGA